MALTIGSVAAALLILGGAGIYFSLRQVLTAHFDTGLLAKADALAAASEVDDGELELDAEILTFAGFGTKAPGVYFEIRTADGRVLAKSPSLGADALDGGTGATASGAAGNIALPDGREGRAAWMKFTPKDAGTPEFRNLQIIVASDVAVLRVLLVALLDHGLTASTVAARVAASTRAGLHDCLSAAYAAMAGPLHGAAPAAAHPLLAECVEPRVL